MVVERGGVGVVGLGGPHHATSRRRLRLWRRLLRLDPRRGVRTCVRGQRACEECLDGVSAEGAHGGGGM